MEQVGGWSEEFSPTGGDDTDFAMNYGKMISGYLKELENHPPIILDQLQLEKKIKIFYLFGK